MNADANPHEPGAQPAPAAVGAITPSPDPVEAWVTALFTRALADLRWPELRKGVQALSALYVHGRDRGDLAPRAAEGRGKLAAFQCVFAPLHLLTARALVGAVPPPTSPYVWPTQILDLGCGSGAAGAGVALAVAACAPAPRVDGVDRVAAHLPHARGTYAAFGLAHRVHAGTMPGAVGAPAAGTLIVLGWSLNELDPTARAATVHAVVRGLRKGAGLLLLEPLSTQISPWWRQLVEQLADEDAQEHVFKQRIPLPRELADMDRSAGLDHQVLGCRALLRWPRASMAADEPR
jgi:hypothetical protein